MNASRPVSSCGCCRSEVAPDAARGVFVRGAAVWVYLLCACCAQRVAERPELVVAGVRRSFDRHVSN